MSHNNRLAIAGLLVVLAGVYLASNNYETQDHRKDLLPASMENFKGFDSEQIQPLPSELNLPKEKVALGQQLFNDPRLSKDNTISCQSCHDLNKGGTDRAPTSSGVNGVLGSVNSPTVFNSRYNFVQFWDGRAATLEEQVAGPIHNHVEMASSWDEVLTKLGADRSYVAAFNKIYADGITPDNIADAIGTFERSLVTPNSRFDRFLKGDLTALTEEEQEGYLRFKDYGCISCHQGINMGGNMYQRFGVVDGYFKDKIQTKADLGRFNVTGREEDRNVFKVPGLRNVAVTPPYLHDGSAETLEEVILIMGRFQLGHDFSDEDVRLIRKFLQTLTGQWKGKTLQ